MSSRSIASLNYRFLKSFNRFTTPKGHRTLEIYNDKRNEADIISFHLKPSTAPLLS
jgi:hypothetical protein